MSSQNSLSDFEELYVKIQRKITSEWHQRLDRILPGSQATILLKLEEYGPQKITTLAEGLCITPGGITGLSDKLISSGFASRTRGVSDRRVVYLEITNQGSQILKEYKAEVKNTIKHIFADLPIDDMNHLKRIFQQVLNNNNDKGKPNTQRP